MNKLILRHMYGITLKTFWKTVAHREVRTDRTSRFVWKKVVRVISHMCLFIPTLSYAFFCPSNFSQINIGDSIEQVQQTCGNPDEKIEKEVKPEGPQEWNYFIPQTVAIDAMHTIEGTLKTSFSFDASGKAVNISVNGIGVGATTICGATNLQLGDKRETVKAACGDPTYINKQSTGSEKESTKVVEFTYKSTPPATLVFENGKLKEKK